jgi:hypothetical protein
MGGTCNTLEEDQKCIQNFGREAEIRKNLERCRLRWEDNTKMNFKEGVDWIRWAEDIFPWRTLLYKNLGIY